MPVLRCAANRIGLSRGHHLLLHIVIQRKDQLRPLPDAEHRLLGHWGKLPLESLTGVRQRAAEQRAMLTYRLAHLVSNETYDRFRVMWFDSPDA